MGLRGVSVKAQDVILWVAGRRQRDRALDKSLEPARCPPPYYIFSRHTARKGEVGGGLGWEA